MKSSFFFKFGESSSVIWVPFTDFCQWKTAVGDAFRGNLKFCNFKFNKTESWKILELVTISLVLTFEETRISETPYLTEFTLSVCLSMEGFRLTGEVNNCSKLLIGWEHQVSLIPKLKWHWSTYLNHNILLFNLFIMDLLWYI